METELECGRNKLWQYEVGHMPNENIYGYMKLENNLVN